MFLVGQPAPPLIITRSTHTPLYASNSSHDKPSLQLGRWGRSALRLGGGCSHHAFL